MANNGYSLAKLEFLDGTLFYRFSAQNFSSGISVKNVWVAGLRQSTSEVLAEGSIWQDWQEFEEGGFFYLHVNNLALSVDAEFSIALNHFPLPLAVSYGPDTFSVTLKCFSWP